MKEPPRDKKIALAFTFFRNGKKMDWSKDIYVLTFHYKTKGHHGLAHWELDNCDKNDIQHGRLFNSLEEAVMHCSIMGISLYKVKENADYDFRIPKEWYWTYDLRNFASPTKTLKRLEKIRVRS